MSNEPANNPESDELYCLTAEGKSDCLRMLYGASPYELGLNLADAGAVLWLFVKSCRKALEKNTNIDERLKKEINETIAKATKLRKMYADAECVTGELPRS